VKERGGILNKSINQPTNQSINKSINQSRLCLTAEQQLAAAETASSAQLHTSWMCVSVREPRATTIESGVQQSSESASCAAGHSESVSLRLRLPLAVSGHLSLAHRPAQPLVALALAASRWSAEVVAAHTTRHDNSLHHWHGAARVQCPWARQAGCVVVAPASG